MAIRTRNLGGFDNGAVNWSYTWDDVTLRIVSVLCTNTSAFATRGTATVLSNGRTFTARVLAGDSLNQSIPQSGQGRLDIGVDPNGRPDGFDWRIEWGPTV
jgi:hypothetical protein